MPASGLSRLTRALLVICQVLALAAVPLSVLAQASTSDGGIDTEPPIIDLQRVESGTLGENQVFTATVTDNRAVTEVTLHFRLADDAAYVSRPMETVGDSNIYTASIDTRNFTTDVIQYYLEARDAGGNRTIQGFVFDPLERRLVAPTAPTEAPTAPTAPIPAESAPSPGMSTGRKVLYGALALLLVGALAAAAGDDSSDNGGGSDNTDGIPLTITVPPLQ